MLQAHSEDWSVRRGGSALFHSGQLRSKVNCGSDKSYSLSLRPRPEVLGEGEFNVLAFAWRIANWLSLKSERGENALGERLMSFGTLHAGVRYRPIETP